jgi:hypothetical protein
MTSFARFKKEGIIQNITMSELEVAICNEENKIKISDAIYNRYYNRYLKSIFFGIEGLAEINIEESRKTEIVKLFNSEYKSGFSIHSNSCIVIESITSFLNGTNYTATKGDETFNDFF